MSKVVRGKAIRSDLLSEAGGDTQTHQPRVRAKWGLEKGKAFLEKLASADLQIAHRCSCVKIADVTLWKRRSGRGRVIFVLSERADVTEHPALELAIIRQVFEHGERQTC